VLAVETHENWLEQHRYLNMMICASTRRRRCAVRPDPDPLSLAPCSLGQGRYAPVLPVPRFRGAILTAAARGTLPQGWSGQRDRRI